MLSTQIGHSGILDLSTQLRIRLRQFQQLHALVLFQMLIQGMHGQGHEGGRRHRGKSRRSGRGAKKGASKSKTMRMPWSGWAQQAPGAHERTIMKRDCHPYSKCFLGPNKSFPVCKKGTCNVSDKGLWAAYLRARQWCGPTRKFKGQSRPRYNSKVYAKTARNAKRRLERSGYSVGKSRS